MQIDIINNRGTINLGSLLETEFLECRYFNIASTFIGQVSVELLNSFKQKNKYKQKNGRLLISLYNCFNSKSVLEALMQLAETSNNIQIRISKNQRFHWKYYHFEYLAKHHIYIGSANCTTNGLGSTGELVNRLRFQKAEASQVKEYNDCFNVEWEEGFDIINFPVSKYKQSSNVHYFNNLDPEIRQLFERTRPEPDTRKLALNRAVLVTGYLSQKTLKLISKFQSNWDVNNWNYFTCFNKSEYEAFKRAELIFIIFKYNRKYTFELSQKTGECIIKTNEGKYFIAHKRAKSISETIQIRSKLEDLGFNYHGKGFSSKSIGKKQALQIAELFK